MYWWNTDLSAAQETSQDKYKHVALIIGASGPVGYCMAEIFTAPDLPGHPWKIYGVSNCRNWIPNRAPLEYIQCDIASPQDTESKLSKLTDVTHIFYVTWLGGFPMLAGWEVNGRMLKNVLNATIPNYPDLRHFSCGFQVLDIHENKIKSEVKLMEDLRLQVEMRKGMTWSVHRPCFIYGFTPYNFRSFEITLCVYAAICKHEGLPLKFPGSKRAWDKYSICSDAQLVAEHHIWGAMIPSAKNQAHNVSNGDVFQWKVLWKVLAEQFGIEYKEYEGEELCLAEMMKDKGSVWEDIVRENGLFPFKLEEVSDWMLAEAIFLDCNRCKLDDMQKNKASDFPGYRDSKTSFIVWIQAMKAMKIVP